MYSMFLVSEVYYFSDLNNHLFWPFCDLFLSSRSPLIILRLRLSVTQVLCRCWPPRGLIGTRGPYMGHPTPHSCTDLSVYCYLLNSLLIATLLLPIYKPTLLFFQPLLRCSLPSSRTPSLSAVSGFIQIISSGFTSLFWFDQSYSTEICKQIG